MKHLYFIRHGLSKANKAKHWAGHIDTPLEPEGHKQAKKAGQAVKNQGLSFDIIVSSPLERAHHTAKHIAAEIGYPHENILLHDLFKERAYGILEGKRNLIAEAKYIANEAMIDTYEGVESFESMQKRAETAVAYLKNLSHDNILIVSHGAFGRALTRVILQKPINRGEVRYKNAELVRLI